MQKKQPLKILIIEDNMIIAADLTVQLQDFGIKVIGIHYKAEDALTTLKNHTPDIILMDIFLKGKMTGIDLAIYLKNTNPIPVIFLSANTDKQILKQAFKAKPYAFIAKPFRRNDLKKALQLTIGMVQQ